MVTVMGRVRVSVRVRVIVRVSVRVRVWPCLCRPSRSGRRR